MEKLNQETKKIMEERFGKDNIIALATLDGNMPSVRNADGFYEDGAFYTITYALSDKMKQIEKNIPFTFCVVEFGTRRFHTNFPFLMHLIRANTREAKSGNKL